jgi:NADPH:quinone reductase-like Zn-dependent oxidoreductase
MTPRALPGGHASGIDHPMKAIVRSCYGPPAVLELRDVAIPTIGDGDVLVRVRASSLNMGDVDYLRGRPFFARLGTGLRKPRNPILGLDVAGEIESVGRAVTRFVPGERVFTDMTDHGFGAFAEYVAVPETALARIPASMSFAEAATIPQSAILALQGLRGGRPVEPGHKVLINGASGNVGPFAVQIAKAWGAEVTGVCRTAKMDLVRSVGADHVIDYTAEDFTASGERYDRILDVAGKHSIMTCRRALRPGGTYIWIGGTTGTLLQALLLGPMVSLLERRTMGITWWWKPFKLEDVAVLAGLIETGGLRPIIDRSYPLSGVPDAIRYLESGQARGKIVIMI